jgi:hypothetical protein
VFSPRFRLVTFTAVGAAVAVFIGAQVAGESYFFGELVLLILLWIITERLHGPHPDAWVLAALLLGYLVGNRGFAQLSLLREFPLLPAEAGLLVCAFALGLRMAFKQTAMVVRDGLNFAILAWMLFGLARLPFDLRQHGFLALRDFAMVYYASFFFVAQGLSQHEPSRRVLCRTLTLAFLLLPPVSVLSTLLPDFFFNVLTWRGVPLVYHKSDLVATSLAAGFFWLWARWEQGRQWLWLIPAAVSLGLITTLISPRAAMAGFAVMTLVWMAARRWQLPLFLTGLALAVVAANVPLILSSSKSFTDTALYSVYERVVSIVDFEGKGTYLHTVNSDPGANNRFRVIWWRSVATQTVNEGPAFGLGFGTDLASRFLAENDMIAAEDFTARSPHSMIMSVFGRMGALGLALFLLVVAMMARSAWPAFRRRDFPTMGLWSVVWIFFISACVGVVLEGPMGAVVFWTLLGLANRPPVEEPADEPVAVADLQPELPADEVAASP